MISTRKKELNPSQDVDNRLPKVNMAGRYLSQYDPAKALEIIERIAEGETLNKVCKGQPGMPHPTTFRRWMVNNPDLARAYEVAIRVSAASLEEEALDAARAIAAAPKDGTHVRAIEVKLGQLRWSAERRDASKFGNKAQVSIKVPIQIITPMDLNLTSAESIPDIYTLEAKQLKSPEAAALEAKGETPLIEGEAIGVGGKGGTRKVTLKPHNPFWDVTQGDDYEKHKSIRQKGRGSSGREEHPGLGDERLSEGGHEEDHGEGIGEDTQDGGEG